MRTLIKINHDLDSKSNYHAQKKGKTIVLLMSNVI
jgi:hypothetical protein